MKRIYLDNCCYNRPYDDQSYISISLETQAKLHIQDLIKKQEFELATSYILRYENSQNPYEMKREAISKFIDENTYVYVSEAVHEEIEKTAKVIMAAGVKYKDACHVACAIKAGCEFFLSTDKRLLKYRSNSIKMLNPIEFIEEMEE